MSTTLASNDYVTTKDLQKFGENLSKQIVDDVVDILKGFMTHIDNRFNKVEARLDGIETRLDKVEARLDSVETKLNRVETRLDSVETRLDGTAIRLDKLEAGQVQLTKMVQTLI